MVIKLTLTENHLKLIPFFFMHNVDDNVVGISKDHVFFLGSHLLDDMAMILGLMDKAIPHSEYSPEGRAFEDETEKYMLELHKYIIDNLHLIELLIHQFVCKGGLTAGTYRCLDSDYIWEKVEE